ncbi:unnamed protein product, partial [Amoebophrya sp. A25]
RKCSLRRWQRSIWRGSEESTEKEGLKMCFSAKLGGQFSQSEAETIRISSSEKLFVEKELKWYHDVLSLRRCCLYTIHRTTCSYRQTTTG